MEHSQKNTDCYFFYYSTCLKGDACAFRHEPTALGCETMCSYWQQGNCLNEHCNYRHMELKKNRKSIPCYWETQPSGCRKPHCCFMHKNARGPAAAEPNNSGRNNDLTSKPVNQEWSNRQDDGKYDSDLRTTLDGSSTESDPGRGGSEAGSFIGSPAVDPLVVNFEEESDNESVPSPTKPQMRMLHVKTLEEIKLERIQAESAAYYNYTHEDLPGIPHNTGELTASRNTMGAGASTLERNLRARLANRLYNQGSPQGVQVTQGNNATKTTSELRENLDFQILSLDEIRKRRRRMHPASGSSEPSTKVPRISEEKFSSDSAEIMVKSLPEIRALKAARRESSTDQTSNGVSSTNFTSDAAAATVSSDLENVSNCNGEKMYVVKQPKTAVTVTAAPPVRLRRAHRTPTESSSRQNNLTREIPEITSSDSSQEAAAVPDRLTLVASRPYSSARDDRQETVKENENKLNDDGRLREETRLDRIDETVANGDSEFRCSSSSSDLRAISVSRRVSMPSVSDDDYLMMDASSLDHTATADNILQDIDELLND